MIAVSNGIPVGIDIECREREVDIAKLLRRIGEAATDAGRDELFRIWTRREARTKAVGGVLMEMPGADVIAADLLAPPGFVAAIALVGREPDPICYRSTESDQVMAALKP
jgi:hypothetical protein